MPGACCRGRGTLLRPSCSWRSCSARPPCSPAPSGSPLWTAGGIAGALALLLLSAALARTLARRTARLARGRPALRLALGAIGARGGETTSVVLSLGLGLAVLAAVGQIDGNLRRAIQSDLPEVAPSYFFVDIQPDQIDGFRARLDDDPAVSRVEAAPMLRGVVTAINGRPASEVTDHWVVQGDRGVTYAATPPEGTTITAGSWWPEDYDGPPQISFSAEEAAEIGLSLGDEITVNILGRDITATITSFRQVDFETAGIGFVIAMNPAALAGAPHTWIATVYADAAAEAAILRDIAGAYPNITAIRIRDVVDRVAEVVSGIAAATRYGAAVTLVTGLLVLIGAATAGERARSFESAVLKTLGATRGRILASFALRSALLGLAAGIVALGGRDRRRLGGRTLRDGDRLCGDLAVGLADRRGRNGGDAGRRPRLRPAPARGPSGRGAEGAGMTDPLFFGYGSLVNLATHDYRDPRPARLTGWRRVWRRTTLREAAFLSVDPAPGVTIDGAVAAVPGGDWAALDERERAYVRHDVSHAVVHDGPLAPCAVYRVSEALIEPASEAAPILLSYLDTVAAGFLALHGAEGLARFFATTDGWGEIRDDRAAPIYPRATDVGPQARRIVDHSLSRIAT